MRFGLNRDQILPGIAIMRIKFWLSASGSW